MSAPPPLKLEGGRKYWVSNAKYGTQLAKLELVSSNGRSLLFQLSEPVAMPTRHGVALGDVLPLRKYDTMYCDIVSGATWLITEEEPGVKHPTK